MATARAIASGNWSATSTWNGGIIPGNGDTVYANSFTVTIDQNLLIGDTNNPSVNAGSFVAGQYYVITFSGTTNFTTIGASSNLVGTTFLCTGAGSGTGIAKAIATLTTLSNTAAGATTGGGGFVMPTAYNANVDLRPSQTVTAPVLTITATTGTINMIGSNIIPGGGVGNSNGLVNSSSATVSLFGYYITAPAYSYGVVNSGSGTINVNSCTLVSGGGGINTSNAINNTSTGTIIITNSSLTGSAQGAGVNNAGLGSVVISTSNISSAGSVAGVTNASTGTVSITNSTLTAGSGPALNNSGSGTITCSGCAYTASTSASAVTGSGTIRLSGTFVSATNGQQAVSASRWILNTTPTTAYIQQALDGINAGSYVRFYTADNNLNQANPTDVRTGVSYASGALTGTLTVPAEGSVSLNVNVGPLMPFTATRSLTTATATLAYSYPYVAGDTIVVTGASNAEWNGKYTIASVISGTSITFNVPVTYSSTAGTGAQMQTVGTGIVTASDVTSAVNSAITSATTSIINPNVTSTINTAVPTSVSTSMDAQWNKQTSTLTVSGSIGERLANTSTVATTGQQLQNILG